MLAGGYLSKEYYTDDDHGTPVFGGDDCLKKAYDFAGTLKR